MKLSNEFIWKPKDYKTKRYYFRLYYYIYKNIFSNYKIKNYLNENCKLWLLKANYNCFYFFFKGQNKNSSSHPNWLFENESSIYFSFLLELFIAKLLTLMLNIVSMNFLHFQWQCLCRVFALDLHSAKAKLNLPWSEIKISLH